MSLSNLTLPDMVLGSLYGRQLVVVNDSSMVIPASSPVSEKQAPLKFLGKNGRKVVVLVNNPGATFLPDEELNLLTQILNACELTLADVAIVNISRSSVTITQLQEMLTPKQLIMLGTESQDIDLPMNFPEYRIQEHGATAYLKAPALTMMLGKGPEARNIKMNLWQSLKTMFGK